VSAFDDFDVIAASAPRWQRQRAIENAITKFAPDVMDAQELVCAIQKAVEDRYDNRAWVAEISDAFHALRQALEKAEARMGSVGPFEAPPQVNDQFA